ncbi:MAG TPA: hypothetical protein VJN18_20885 [Polyangiaceae bacterium]|nr:hypothetical protein [Polyangiaceae bacterium]
MRNDVLIQRVLEKCDALKRAGFWTAEPEIRPAAWLNNFLEVEQPTAAVVLDHFLYYSDRTVARLLRGAYRTLSNGPLPRGMSPLTAEQLAEAVLTPVQSEQPSAADSGWLFCRKARQLLGIPEDRLLLPVDALEAALRGETMIFVDDFVGSGNQFLSTWSRPLRTTAPYSFADAHALTAFPAFYVTLVATQLGVANIERAVPSVAVVPAHRLGDTYSVSKIAYSQLAPRIPALGSAVENLISKYSPQLVVPSYMETPAFRKYGFHALGLMLAFEHSTPDATIPLLWAPGGTDWTPLVQRK